MLEKFFLTVESKEHSKISDFQKAIDQFRRTFFIPPPNTAHQKHQLEFRSIPIISKDTNERIGVAHCYLYFHKETNSYTLYFIDPKEISDDPKPIRDFPSADIKDIADLSSVFQKLLDERNYRCPCPEMLFNGGWRDVITNQTSPFVELGERLNAYMNAINKPSQPDILSPLLP